MGTRAPNWSCSAFRRSARRCPPSISFKTQLQLSVYKKLKACFENKYQIVLRNIENFEERTSFPLSYAALLLVAGLWFCANFGASLCLARTVLARWMDPAFVETENRKKIGALATAIDNLEGQVDAQATFIASLQKVLRGKSAAACAEPPVENRTEATGAKLPTPPAANAPSDAATDPVPATLPRLPTARKLKRSTQPLATGLLFPPMQGMITEPFDPKNGHYGVDVVATAKQPIKAIASGAVVFSDWSVDTGWVLVIQHHTNLVSICKHCAVLFKKVGNLVKAGDVVALMGDSGELSTGPHLHFELWHEGVALNPEAFIHF